MATNHSHRDTSELPPAFKVSLPATAGRGAIQSGNPFIAPRMLKSVNGGHAVNDCYDIDARTAKAAEAFIGLLIRNTAVLLGKGLIVILAIVSTYLVVTM